MTAHAVVHKIGVIRHAARRKPTVGIMAGIALGGCHHMIRSFATRDHAIMTAGTNADGLRMIDGAGRQWRPRIRCGVMTEITGVGTEYMAACRFAMTISTNTNYPGMIDRRGCDWRPRRREDLMASVASIGGTNVIDTLATCGHAMTACAIAGKPAVIGNTAGAKPTGGVMTNIALLCRWRMSWPLATRQGTVMTVGTNADSLCMIGCTIG